MMQQGNSNLVEIPQEKKIVENRDFAGKFKVFGAWYLWQAFFGLIINLFLVRARIDIPKGNYPDIDIVLRGTIAVICMNYNMNRKAHKRWQKKYQE